MHFRSLALAATRWGTTHFRLERVVMAVAFAIGPADVRAVSLAENGTARAVIVVGDPANPFHVLAAKDLQHHLQLATGAGFAIENAAPAGAAGRDRTLLVVGAGKVSRELGVTHSDLEREAYRVVTKGNAIVFVGHDHARESNATAWAVSSFLDRHLGVRWLWPGELGTHVPRRPTLEIPSLNFTGRPALELRRLRTRATGPVVDWLRHHQMGSRSTFRFGHAFTDWWEKYHAAHPDFFAVPPPGQKQPYPQPDRVKLRIGNPAVAEQILANWRAAGRPDNWNVCPNDGSGWDTSDASRAMDLPDVFSPEDIWRNKANLSRRFVRFWNGLLVRMREENPRVTLSSYAYSCYRNPPADVKLEPGMVMGIVHSYSDRPGWRQWHDAGAKLILRPNWWHLGGSAPHLPLHPQGEYFEFARAHAMIGFDFDSLMGEWGTQGVLYYLIARMSWRPDLSVDDISGEYASAFGRAAPLVRDYIGYWEEFTRKVASPVPAGGEVSQNPNGLYETMARKHGITAGVLASTWSILPHIYTDDVIAPAEAILKRAGAAVAGDDELSRRRVEYLLTALTLLKEHREVIRLASRAGRKPTRADPDLLRQVEKFEKLRGEAASRFGPIGFEQTLPSRLRITDPRKLEGL